MSSNLDLVRSIYSALERGDFTNVDWADPEIEYVIADGPEPATFRGLPGMAEAMRTLFGEIEDYRAEAEEYRELDAGHVLVLERSFGRGRRSGVPFSSRVGGAGLFHVRDGKVTRLVIYFEREHALADLGLAPKGDTA
jgi:ketosteroid isomerase-like protein